MKDFPIPNWTGATDIETVWTEIMPSFQYQIVHYELGLPFYLRWYYNIQYSLYKTGPRVKVEFLKKYYPLLFDYCMSGER